MKSLEVASGTGGIAKLDLRTGKVTGWLYPTTGRPHRIYYSTAKVRRRD